MRRRAQRPGSPAGQRLVDPVELGPRAAVGLDGAVDEVVVLERPGDLAARVAELVGATDGLHYQYRIDAAAPPAGLDPERHEAHPVDLALVPEEPGEPDGQAERGEPALHVAEGLVHVGHGEGEG